MTPNSRLAVSARVCSHHLKQFGYGGFVGGMYYEQLGEMLNRE